jgi:hypothetical protein
MKAKPLNGNTAKQGRDNIHITDLISCIGEEYNISGHGGDT